MTAAAATAVPATDLEEFLLAEFELPEEPEKKAVWRIEGDREAAWAFRKMAEAEAEIERLEAQAKLQRDQIAAWLDAALSEPKHDLAFFEAKLVEYRRRMERENPKLRQTYPVPGGKIARRAGSRVIEVTDEEAFVAWALEHDREALSISPKKSRLTAKDAPYAWKPGPEDQAWASPVADEAGERIPGVQIVGNPPSYSAKTTTNPQES